MKLTILLLVANAMIGDFSASANVPFDATTTVSSDDNLDAYVGTGGLLLPETYSGSRQTKQRVASCMQCVWRYTIYCAVGTSALCAHAVSTCRLGEIRYRVWFGINERSVKDIGSLCWGLNPPTTRRDIERKMRAGSLRYLPPLAPAISPKGKTFTSIPILVWSGQHPQFVPAPMNLLGRSVQVRATATWLWNWGDGTQQWTVLPGSLYPHKTLTHQYRRPGNYHIRVSSYWRANYEIHGIGFFPVQGVSVRQNSDILLSVRAARAVLVGN